MRPGRFHLAITVTDTANPIPGAMFEGAHFYSFVNMHATLLARWRDTLFNSFITNAHHADTVAVLDRMLFYLFERRSTYMKWLEAYEAIDPFSPDYIGESKVMSYGGVQSIASLIWQSLCFDTFAAKAADKSPYQNIPDTILQQNWHARHVANLWLREILDLPSPSSIQLCWFQLNAEMEDRVANMDDVISPVRSRSTYTVSDNTCLSHKIV